MQPEDEPASEHAQDAMAAEWEAALGASAPAGAAADAGAEAAPSQPLDFDPETHSMMQIPVQLTAEVGRTRIPIRHILQLAQGSVVELETEADEPMDVLVNGHLIARGEVIVVNERFGIRLTGILPPSERVRRSKVG